MVIIHVGIACVSNKANRIGHIVEVVQNQYIELAGSHGTIINRADKIIDITLKVFYVGSKGFSAFFAARLSMTSR